MQKVYDYIFDLSPKKLAIYLVLAPLVLFFMHTMFTIVYQNLSGSSPTQGSGDEIIFGILSLCLAALVLLWLFWLRSTVHSVTEMQLGLPINWFHIAYAILLIFIIFNLSASIIEPLVRNQGWGDDYLYLIYASREFINFGGIMMAYPIVCHYAARAATAKRKNKPATFVQAIPFTILLIFGTVLGLPALHKYVSRRPSTNSQIITIYAIAFGLFVIMMIVGFIAAITGLV